MKRIATGLCVAAAFSFAASLGAQTSTTSSTSSSMSKDKKEEVTVTGCLQRGADGNYMLTNAMLEEPTHGGTSTTTGTTGTTSGATTSGSTMSHGTTAASTWVLEGGSDLDKHVGHKIQVTGREVASSKKDYERSSTAGTTSGATGTTSGTTATGTTGTTGTTETTGSQMSTHSESTSGQKLDVKSVKMISSSCS
jgi:hypothetical protein